MRLRKMADPKDEATGAAPGAPAPTTGAAEESPSETAWTIDAPSTPRPEARMGEPEPAAPSGELARSPMGAAPPPLPLPPPSPAAVPRRRPMWRRVLRALSTYLGILLALAIVGGAFLLHSAVTGQNLAVLRTLVGGFGRIVAGQRTERLELRVRVRPDARDLSGVAMLEMRANDPRQQLYFLLNDALRIRRVWMEQANGAQSDLPYYRLWMFAVVQLPEPLAADGTTRVGIEYGGHPTSGSLGSGTAWMEPDDVLLSVYDFWYPTDLQSFFTADVEVTAPARLDIVHNGDEQSRETRGDSLIVRWTTPRPVAGLSLVAGRYRVYSRAGSRRYRVYLPNGVDLDPDRLLSSLASADASLTQRYGDAGFPQITLALHRGVGRAFNDGSGLLAVAPRYFRRGDYGFATIAHEVAHNWWGGTVAEKWLQPGTGGEWIVEGMAEFSSLIAVREELGQAALVERLRSQFYDPTATGILMQASALDNGLDPNAHATIYNKGAYVTFMLARLMGEEAFFTAAREFIDKFRHQQAGCHDFETVLASHSEADLSGFFTAWVRSNVYLDLALDPQDGNAAAHNLGSAPAPVDAAVWRFQAAGEPDRETLVPGATTPLGSATRLVLDPLLATADMYRDNNVFPRWPNPRAVARSARGEFLVTYGEPFSWSPARLVQMAANGQTARSWDFDHGIAGDPWWSVDGTRVLVLEKDNAGSLGLVALNATDGSQRTMGPATAATAAADWIVVARGDRLVQIKGGREGGRETTLVRQRGAELKTPLSTPDGSRIAYVAERSQEMDLRVMDADGTNDRLLLTWQPGEVKWVWSADGARLFAVLPGDWDWQLWEIPVQGTPRVIVREAASISEVAAAQDGTRLAVVAAPTIDYGAEHRDVYVVQRTSAKIQRIRLNDADVHRLAWLDDDTLLVIVSDPATPAVPAHRELRGLSLTDEALHAFP